MSIDVTDLDGSVRVRFTDNEGNSADVVVVGESVDSVRSRADDISKRHNLKQIAKQS
jgi:hypothetical protein